MNKHFNPIEEQTKLNKPIEYSTIQGYKKAASPKATLFECHMVNGMPLEESKDVWFPISRTKSITTSNNPEEFDNITVESWLVSKSGLE